MKTLSTTLIALAAIAFSTAAHAHTSVNVLFTCTGTLKNFNGSYSIKDEITLEDNPMNCMIDDAKVLRQVLSVCRVDKICVVSARERPATAAIV